MSDDYRIALRPDRTIGTEFNPERMDDIVVMDVKMFRAEQMDKDHWWVCLYLDEAGDQRLVFGVRASARPRRIDWAVEELPEGGHVYEDNQ